MNPERRSTPRGIASRMGRWSSRHRKIAIFGWLGFVVASFVVGGQLGTTNINLDTSNPGESGRMIEILAKEFDHQPA
jgi:uncharacterized membrane protein YdfJ with MMPL/SSD domain